jgi:hypothetical protein
MKKIIDTKTKKYVIDILLKRTSFTIFNLGLIYNKNGYNKKVSFNFIILSISFKIELNIFKKK